jgi:DNA polymerase-3 subunit epsilon
MAIREIALDTETTGLSHANGDRMIEIGCVEIVDKVMTGVFFHTYLSTDKYISKSAFNIHGITNNFLKNKPSFHEVAKKLIDFIDTSKLVIHNARFDIGFLNNELSATPYSKISDNKVIDTLSLARRMYPGQSVSLDALCRKFSIDLEKRNKHGALIDSELLALVYIEMTRAKQAQMDLQDRVYEGVSVERKCQIIDRTFKLTRHEEDLHEKLIAKLNGAMW